MKSLFKIKGLKSIGVLIFSVLFTEGIGFLSGFLSMPASGLYETLKKPYFSPPSWVFPVIWPILYFLMALAAYRIWLRGKQGKNVPKALMLYIIQLGLNFLWSIVFFKLNLYALAFLELLFLLFFIILTTLEFFRIDKAAGFLMLPYLLWAAFSAVLNYSIWFLNESSRR